MRGYLSHVFEKVGVKSRRELLKRLFLDNLSPQMPAYAGVIVRGRLPGRSSPVQGVIVFLASPAAAYITGQTVVVDGGATAW